MRTVDVVIPVYEGYEETVACLESVVATIDGDWARMVVIDDCTPNPGIGRYLRELDAKTPCMVLLENSENLGFVAAVNRGMAYDTERDVLLLNSDVEVAGDWLARIREAAYSRENVASVTPFSNNATVCSFPNFCEDNRPIFGLGLDDIDRQMAAEFQSNDVFELPTGIGCCMYMRRDCMDAIGYFDLATFGRGYGEENDWCQRAIAAGFVNLHLANTYVHHHGGVSFGKEHSPRLARALEILDRKYPHYHSDIQRFIASDPARATRVRAWLRLFAAQDRPRVLMICHKLGGGARQHVDELAGCLGSSAMCLLMIPDKDGESVRLSCYDGDRRLKDGLYFEVDGEYDKLLGLLRGLGIGRVHFHHTMGLPTRLWTLPADLDCDYDVTIHDFYFVNGNPSMTDKDGRYADEDSPEFDARCAGYRPLPGSIDAARWRDNQRRIIDGAARVIFPSRDTSRRFQKFFPVSNPVVAWHPDHERDNPYPAPEWRAQRGRALRVLVLGALSKEKGADLLDSVANALAVEDVEFHLLGYAYRRLGPQVIFHGPYDNDNVHQRVAGIEPDIVWFPALWPETYSYTLSIALARGLPVVAPNLGAFPERLHGRRHTAVVDWDLSLTEWCEFWSYVLQRDGLPEVEVAPPSDGAREDFYASDYLAPVAVREATIGTAQLVALDSNLSADSLKLSRSERLLKKIWHFSLRPMGSRLISMVPFRVQRMIKRSLSHRPMHDIVGE